MIEETIFLWHIEYTWARATTPDEWDELARQCCALGRNMDAAYAWRRAEEG